MRAYGSQHTLPEHILKKHGLYTQLTRLGWKEDGGFRFVTPIEIALLQGCVGPAFIPQEEPLAFHMLGNAISTFHAAAGIFAFTQVLRVQHCKQTQSMALLLRHLKENCCKPRNLAIIAEDGKIYPIRTTKYVAGEEVEDSVQMLDEIRLSVLVNVHCGKQRFVYEADGHHTAHDILACLKIPETRFIVLQQGEDFLLDGGGPITQHRTTVHYIDRHRACEGEDSSARTLKRQRSTSHAFAPSCKTWRRPTSQQRQSACASSTMPKWPSKFGQAQTTSPWRSSTKSNSITRWIQTFQKSA